MIGSLAESLQVSHVMTAMNHRFNERLLVVGLLQPFARNRIFHPMLIDFERAFVFLSTISLPQLLLSSTLANMDSLDSPFTVELNGSPIVFVGNNADDKTQAKIGSEAVIFTLNGGRLQHGDWVLGRNKTENRSMLPKEVYWFKRGEDNDKRVKPITAHQDGDTIQLKFDGASLMLEDDKIFTDLLGGNLATAVDQICLRLLMCLR